MTDEKKPDRSSLPRRAFLLTLAAGTGVVVCQRLLSRKSAPTAPGPEDQGPVNAEAVWREALAALGPERAPALAALAADLLPPDPLQLTAAATGALAKVEAAHLQTILAETGEFEAYKQGLELLRVHVKANWHELPDARRTAVLDEIFAVEPEKEGEPAPAANLVKLQEFLTELRDDLEEAFWQAPVVVTRLTNLAGGGTA